MVRSKTNDSERGVSKDLISRRSILQAAGVASLTGFGVGRTFARDDRVEIPYVKRGDEVVMTKEVPQEWYEHVQHVRQVADTANEQFSSNPGVLGMGIAKSNRRYGGKNGLLVEAKVHPSQYAGTLPDEVEGIPIETTETEGAFNMSDCVHLDDFSEVQGGITVEGEVSDGELQRGTSCLKVYNDNDDPRLLTANHLWGSCSYPIDEDAYQNGTKFGKVDMSDPDADIALIKEQSSEKSLEPGINDENTNWDVSGYYTEDSIEDMISEEREVRSMGCTTGLTEGPVTGKGLTPPDTCYDADGEAVEVEAVGGEGDSGGPVYGIEEYFGNRYAVMLNVIQAGDDQFDSINCTSGVADPDNESLVGQKQYGIAFYHLQDEYNLSGAT